jgi:hypothetical protein
VRRRGKIRERMKLGRFGVGEEMGRRRRRSEQEK